MTTAEELAQSDSDEAPEEVAFSETKERVFTVTKQENEAQQKRKRQNKARDELYKQQKKEKLAKLEAERLPDDVLEGLSEDPPTDPAALAAPGGTHTQFESSDDEEEVASEVDSGVSSTITSKISVKDVQGIKARAFSSALAFKAAKEAGSSDIKRTTARDRQLLKEKRAVRRVR